MQYKYIPSQVCSRAIYLDMDGDIVKHVEFLGGCDGNLKALSILVQGMSYEEIKSKLGGIHCGFKSTSCSDQLVKAIEAAMKAAAKEK